MKLTEKQKLEVFTNKFYRQMQWEPKEGDLYTIARNDLDVFVIEKIEAGEVRIKCLSKESSGETFKLEGFTTEGFGKHRMHIQPWIAKELQG